jgi:hypothetical protein
VPTDDSILEELDECALEYGIPTMADALVASVVNNKQYASAIRAAVASETPDPESRNLLLDAYDSWISGHEFMVYQILPEPMDFFDPIRYLAKADKWVAAPVHVSTTSTELFHIMSPLLKELRDLNWRTDWGIGNPDEGVSYARLIRPTLTAGIDVFGSEASMFLSESIWLVYALWSRSMLSPINRWVAAETLKLGNPEREVLRL